MRPNEEKYPNLYAIEQEHEDEARRESERLLFMEQQLNEDPEAAPGRIASGTCRWCGKNKRRFSTGRRRVWKECKHCDYPEVDSNEQA